MVYCIGVKRKFSFRKFRFSLVRPNLLVGCPVHVTLGGLAASGTGAFVVVPG